MSKITISDFYCTECGRRGIPIPRREGAQREPGHLKSLYCLHCGEEKNFAEVRPFGEYNFEDFWEEYTAGRFVDGKKIPIADLKSCKLIGCIYNKHGKCWNSNNSYDCRFKEEQEYGTESE